MRDVPLNIPPLWNERSFGEALGVSARIRVHVPVRHNINRGIRAAGGV